MPMGNVFALLIRLKNERQIGGERFSSASGAPIFIGPEQSGYGDKRAA
jgi:hypothetical protein